jgi:small GTP-binding protein
MKTPMSNAENQEKPKKIVIMGMENAGKSTIVRYLQITSYEEPDKPPDMNPTKNIARTEIEQNNIVVWDFGGQEKYRNEYLENPETYFHEVSYFYYVVDVQDYYRLFSSTMYFMAIFNVIKRYSPEAKIVFLFHKWDPDYDPSTKNLKEKFLEKVESLLQKRGSSFLMFDTSIFTPNTIRSAFNLELLQIDGT